MLNQNGQTENVFNLFVRNEIIDVNEYPNNQELGIRSINSIKKNPYKESNQENILVLQRSK